MNMPGRHGYVVPGANAWLADVLTHPAQTVDAAGLAANWQRTVLHVICERPPGLEEGLWMAGAVRGAWLSMLHGMPHSSPIEPDPFGRPPPFEAFYLSHARVTRRNDVPKPYWIEVDLLPGQRLLIRLGLFGFADLWRDAAIEALLLALEHGVSLRERAPIDAPWPVLDWYWTLERFLDLRVPALHAVASIAGLSLRGKRGIDGADMLMRAAGRVSGLARWQSIRLDIDWGELRSSLAQLHFALIDEPPSVRDRMSRHHGAVPIPMPSIRAHLSISRLSERWWTLLQLAETCGLGGGDAVFGYGAFVLV